MFFSCTSGGGNDCNASSKAFQHEGKPKNAKWMGRGAMKEPLRGSKRVRVHTHLMMYVQ